MPNLDGFTVAAPKSHKVHAKLDSNALKMALDSAPVAPESR